MFKKKPQIKTLSPLRSSDRRRTADRIIEEFKLDLKQASDESPEEKTAAVEARTALRNSLLPDNALSAKFTTTSGPNLKQVSGVIYVGSHGAGDQRILWFSIDDTIYPTVYSLWRNPGLVPLLHTPTVVIEKIQNGSDLMIPGLAGPPFPSGATKGAIVGVADYYNPSVPLTIGICEVDVSSLKQTQGAKGHAVNSVHWYGDEIWNWSTSGRSGLPAPEALQGWLQSESTISQSVNNLSLEDDDEEQDGDGGGVALSAPEPSTSHVKKEDIAEVVDMPEEDEMSTKDIDNAFEQAFLYGIYHYRELNPDVSKHNIPFPLAQSWVMSDLVLPFLPAYTSKQTASLVIKKTSYKNARKFIKALEKRKLVLVKEKPGNEVDIWDIDFNNPTFTDFVPYRLPRKQSYATNGVSQLHDDGQESTADDAIGQRLRKVDLFKPNASVLPIFKSNKASTKSYYTPAELRAFVVSYVEAQNLIPPTNKRMVNLDLPLSSALFPADPKGVDAELLARGFLPRDALIERFTSRCAPCHVILRNDEDVSSVKPRSGAAPKVEIILETRGGNKTATRVHGLEDYFIRAQPLADELRKTCAGSTSVEPWTAGGKGKMEVMVQGPQKEAVVKALEKRGVDKKWIEVLDKTKGKKK